MDKGGQLFHAWGRTVTVYRITAPGGGGAPSSWENKGALRGCPKRKSERIHSIALSPHVPNAPNGDQLFCGTAGAGGLYSWQFHDLEAFNKSLALEVANDIKRPVMFEEFRIGRPLGEGSHGFVYRSLWAKGNNKPVAIKLFHPHFTDILRSEAEALAQSCQHPNILNIIGLCLKTSKRDHFPGLVLDFWPNGTLHKLVKDSEPGGGLPFFRIKALGGQIASALEFCHSDGGRIHRDLKSDNSEPPHGRAGG